MRADHREEVGVRKGSGGGEARGCTEGLIQPADGGVYESR